MGVSAAVLLSLLAGLVQPAPVEIVIGSGDATPGGAVTIAVHLDPAGHTVIGGGNDIELGPLAAVQTRADGSFACDADPLLVPLLPPTFTCVSPPPEPCTRLRAIVFRPVGGPPLPGGALYRCTIEVAAGAAPGLALPLTMRAPRASGPVGRALAVRGYSGAITVLVPTPTATPSATPLPSATPSPSPSATPSGTQTRTASRTATRTRTPRTPIPTGTATQTPTPSASATPSATPAIALRLLAGAARPGTTAPLTVTLADPGGRASGVSVDLLLPAAVFDVAAVAATCTLDARLDGHALSAHAVGDPPTAPALRRLRLVVVEQTTPPRALGGGPLLTCHAPLRPDAPLDHHALSLDRLFAADGDGTLLTGVGGAGATLVVDAEAPSPTASATPTPTAAASATPTRTATAAISATRAASPSPATTATATPVASRTASASRCAGDCDGDGMVTIGELVQAVAIATGAPLDTCPGLDADGDGAIEIGELVGAVTHALAGCERTETHGSDARK